MAKATLVTQKDVIAQALVTTALSRRKIPVTFCDWYYVPQLDEWQLIIATPLFDSEGPHNAYAKVILALQDEGVYPDVPIRRIFVKSAEDPLVRTLEKEAKVLSEGTIHIVDYKRATKSPSYSMTFMPYTGRGGAVPSQNFNSKTELREFLERRLPIEPSSVDAALNELGRRRTTSIFNVQLTTRDARKLGLA